MYRLCNFAISVSADTTHHTTYTAEVLRQGCVRYRTGEAVRQARLRACVECVACILIDISISKCKRVPSELSDCEGKFERAPARARYYPLARRHSTHLSRTSRTLRAQWCAERGGVHTRARDRAWHGQENHNRLRTCGGHEARAPLCSRHLPHWTLQAHCSASLLSAPQLTAGSL